MRDLQSLFHDLSNKILLLTSTLEGQKRGMVVSEDRITSIINRVMTLSESIRTSLTTNIQLTYESVDVVKIHDDVKSFLPVLEELYSPLKIGLNSRLESGAHVIYEKGLIHQIIENAVENSYKAGATTMLIDLSIFDQRCRINIIDNGKGFPGAGVPEFFPLGFGSRVIHNNAVRMNGEAFYSCIPQSGTCLTVRLPICCKAGT
jgi:signal transduction histidine kinase